MAALSRIHLETMAFELTYREYGRRCQVDRVYVTMAPNGQFVVRQSTVYYTRVHPLNGAIRAISPVVATEEEAMLHLARIYQEMMAQAQFLAMSLPAYLYLAPSPEEIARLKKKGWYGEVRQGDEPTQ